MRRLTIACGALLVAVNLIGAPARAEIASVGEGGFIFEKSARIKADPLEAWRRLLAVGAWWSDDHTYSGDAANMSIKARPGGCFCEKLKGGGFVEHLAVVYAVPGETLRMTGGLGPLQALGASGALTFDIKGIEGGVEVTMTYKAGGYAPDGWAELAPIVDMVLSEQLKRYAAQFDAAP